MDFTHDFEFACTRCGFACAGQVFARTRLKFGGGGHDDIDREGNIKCSIRQGEFFESTSHKSFFIY